MISFSILRYWSRWRHILAAHPEADVIYGDTVIMSSAPEPQPVPFHRVHSASWSWQKVRWLERPLIPHQSAFTSRRYFSRVGNFTERLKICGGS